MGYQVHTIASLPMETNINFYIFVINGGLEDPVYKLLDENFSRLARNIGADSILVKGFDREFSYQVIDSYFTGFKDSVKKSIYSDWLLGNLPALLITDCHPSVAGDLLDGDRKNAGKMDKVLRLLIPLRQAIKQSGELELFFRELEAFTQGQNDGFLDKFRNPITLRDMAIDRSDVLLLQPNFFGLGINVNAFLKKLRKSRV
jgi:hypothetical protein